MAFADFLKNKQTEESGNQINESTVELTKDEIVEKLNKLHKDVTDKLKVIPVKYNNYYIEIGTRSFEIEGIPAVTISLNRNELRIDQSSTTFTKKSIVKYSEMLKELHDNYDFISDSLKEHIDLQDKLRDLYEKTRK